MLTLSDSEVHCCMTWFSSSWTSIIFPTMNSLNRAECRCLSFDLRLWTMTSRKESITSLMVGTLAPRERATSRTNGTNTVSGASTPVLTNLRKSLPRGWPVEAAFEMWNMQVAFDCKISLRDEPVSVGKQNYYKQVETELFNKEVPIISDESVSNESYLKISCWDCWLWLLLPDIVEVLQQANFSRKYVAKCFRGTKWSVWSTDRNKSW